MIKPLEDAAIGAFSHVALDSIMHADVRPFAPFIDASPLLHVVPLGLLHWLCVAGGAAGLALIGVRQPLRPTE